MSLSSPWLLWFLAGVVLFLLELFVPGFVLFFFALGAWMAAGGAWLFEVGLNGQILIFLIASILSLVSLRSLVRKVFSGDRAEGDRADQVMAPPGTRCVVTVDIAPPAEGKVKYSGSSWRAQALERIDAGEMVEIVRQEGLLMMVKRVGSQDPVQPERPVPNP